MNDTKETIPAATQGDNWHFAKSLQDLREKKALLARVSGRQIALFETKDGVRACDNRCPHEGYPLSEGSLAEVDPSSGGASACILTCNWHNWKFNLDTGENLYGGDRLRTYPVEVRGDEIWVELSDPPYAEQYSAIMNNLRDAVADHSYDRIARETARLIRLGADPLDVLRLSIGGSWQRMEFGWTHAFAGMADWLQVYQENPEDTELQLVCLVESVAHVAFDVLREPVYPYAEGQQAYDEAGFLAAVEREDQVTAVQMIRGGLCDGLQFTDLERGLTRAALAHYNDFGHALIYVTKAGYLIGQLGETVAEPLLLSLVHGLVFATREDKIPQFREYQPALDSWVTQADKDSPASPKAQDWHKAGINKALDLTLAQASAPPETLYQALLEANAVNLLSFNLEQQDKIHVPVSGNVGWLDFTHGLTFANAVRKQCSRYPELWPQGLLQMACFSGRNAGFTTQNYDVERWCGDDPFTEMDELLQGVFNHGQGEYIVSVHLLKTALAVREEMRAVAPDKARLLLAGLKRFIASPLRRRQPRRTAYQSLVFVGTGKH